MIELFYHGHFGISPSLKNFYKKYVSMRIVR